MAENQNSTHSEKFANLSEPIRQAGAKSHAFVAIDGTGEVFWGANFGFKPEALLRQLRIMESDIKQYIKREQS